MIDEIPAGQGVQEVKELNALAEEVLGAAIEVHKQLGPGLLESIHETCLDAELKARKLLVQRQVVLPIIYKSMVLAEGLRLDLLVEKRLVIEVKAVEVLMPIHSAQLITYLKRANLPTGLLLNFNVSALRQGIKRLYFDARPTSVPPLSH